MCLANGDNNFIHSLWYWNSIFCFFSMHLGRFRLYVIDNLIQIILCYVIPRIYSNRDIGICFSSK